MKLTPDARTHARTPTIPVYITRYIYCPPAPAVQGLHFRRCGEIRAGGWGLTELEQLIGDRQSEGQPWVAQHTFTFLRFMSRCAYSALNYHRYQRRSNETRQFSRMKARFEFRRWAIRSLRGSPSPGSGMGSQVDGSGIGCGPLHCIASHCPPPDSDLSPAVQNECRRSSLCYSLYYYNIPKKTKKGMFSCSLRCAAADCLCRLPAVGEPTPRSLPNHDPALRMQRRPLLNAVDH
jgi:hypothetical protein